MLKLLGYPDKYSAEPGEDISFMVSAEDNQNYDASLIRVICGDCNPEGPGLQSQSIPSAIDGTYEGRKQSIHAGSWMEADVPHFDASKSFTLFATIWPTLVKRNNQVLMSQWNAKINCGFKLLLTEQGMLTFTISDGANTQTVALPQRLLERQWYHVSCAVDADKKQVTLSTKPVLKYAFTDDEGTITKPLTVSPMVNGVKFLIAAAASSAGKTEHHYNGKIDSPALLAGVHTLEARPALLVRHIDFEIRSKIIALWDFSIGISTTKVTDISNHGCHGSLHNLPARGMKSWNWTGEFHKWTDRPDHYGAIHFHHDDLYDAKWERSLTLTIPADMKSGAYALRITCGENTKEETNDFYIPFFVRSKKRPAGTKGKRNRIALLAPTVSYMAYANHAEHITARGAEQHIGRLIEFGHIDLYMYDHPELGGSLYDSHADGSGVCYSSRLRPVLNFLSAYHSWLGGAGSALWQYNADTHLLSWLEAKGFEFDVITDEDLHREGVQALDDYRVVLTGTHPEYYSSPMWKGLKSWIDDGGRLMYLGANGFYWHVAFHNDLPGAIEIRRAEDGTRTWMAEPGEYYHSFTGEMGGLYRRIGSAPNVMCGLGFIAMGFDTCTHYRKAEDADNPRAAFIFEGVVGDIIGDTGLVGGGAAGLEIDCINTKLGSPVNILRLASSENHTQRMMLVNEEFGGVPPNLGGDQNDRVRADLAFYETPSGGAVFSVGSIAWCGSLPSNEFNNNVSKITENVLRRFADEQPFKVT
jgi:N,N-dimethylformamidase